MLWSNMQLLAQWRSKSPGVPSIFEHLAPARPPAGTCEIDNGGSPRGGSETLAVHSKRFRALKEKVVSRPCSLWPKR